MLSPQATLSRLFLLWDGWVGAAGGQLCPLLRLGVGRTRRGSCIRRSGHPGHSCAGLPARLPSSLPLPALLRSWLSSLPLILLASPEPKPPHGLHLGPEPHPSPGSQACRSGTQFSHPAAPLLPIAAEFVLHSPLFTSLSLSPSLSTLCPLVWLSPFPCPVSPALPLYSPHGLSYRGASTSPSSACHLHSE